MARGNFRRPEEVDAELDAVRSELRQNFFGLKFLIESVEAVAAEAEKSGELSRDSAILLQACLGANAAAAVLYANLLIKKGVSGKSGQGFRAADPSNPDPAEESRTDTEPADAPPMSAQQTKDFDGADLVRLIRLEKLPLELERDMLTSDQLADDCDVMARVAAVLTSSQLSRAETTYENRMYKALNKLFSLRFQQAQLELARESSRQLALKAQSRKSRRAV